MGLFVSMFWFGDDAALAHSPSDRLPRTKNQAPKTKHQKPRTESMEVIWLTRQLIKLRVSLNALSARQLNVCKL